MTSDYSSSANSPSYWQQQAHQCLVRGDYAEAASFYEQAIEADPSVKFYYWHLGLMLLLQGQDVEAQTTWLLAMVEGEPEQSDLWTSELVQVLQVEAERQEALKDYSAAWLIRQHIREISPENINNLLHFIQISIYLETFSGEDLTRLGVIDLLQSEKRIDEPSLLLQVRQSALEYAPHDPSIITFSELCRDYIPESQECSNEQFTVFKKFRLAFRHFVLQRINLFLKKYLNPVYITVPQYNSNSGIRSKRYLLNKLLDKNKINLLDIGCRGGALPELSDLYKYINLIGFDADQDEVERLNLSAELSHKFNRVAFFAYCLDAEARERTLYITKSPGSSSLYKPNPIHALLFDAGHELVDEVKLRTEKLDVIAVKESINDIDIIKLDTQGSELDILQGATDYLMPDILLIESEVEFYEMYENQPLFSDVDSFLRKNKFNLLYLNRCYANMNISGTNCMYSKGSLIFGDALYAKDILETKKLTPEKIIRFIVLLANYGHYDYAMAIFRVNAVKLSGHKIILEELLGVHKSEFAFTISYAFAVLVDWLVFFLLKLRRWNHLRFDSDRSYPTR